MTLRDVLQTRSRRFWIATGMMIAIAPVIVASAVGFVVLKNGAIASFQHVADRQRADIIQPSTLV
jgi:type III secretory pathway component EscS